MKSVLASLIGWFLLISALGIYIYGIWAEIDKYCHNGNGIIHSELKDLIITLQTMLLANLGALLGISVANPQTSTAKKILFLTPSPGEEKRATDPKDVKMQIQLIASAVFLVSLVACVIAWIATDVKSPDEGSIVIHSVRMFLGTVLAYVAALIGSRVSQ